MGLASALLCTPSPSRVQQETDCIVVVPDVIVRANLCSVYTGSRCHGLLCGFIQMPGKEGEGLGAEATAPSLQPASFP